MRLAAGPVGPAAPRASAESGASGPPVPAAAGRRRPGPSPVAHALPGAAGPGLLAAAAARTTLLAAQRGGGLEHLPPLAAPQESLRTPLTHQPDQCIPDLQASRSWHRQEADSRLPLRLFPVNHTTLHPCPQCGARQWLQGIIYYQCAPCGYRDGSTLQEILEQQAHTG